MTGVPLALRLAVPRMVRAAVGLFLLVAASLKIHALASDPFAEDSLLASPRLLVAAIELEIVLGLWLLSGWFPRAGWIAALGFFGIATATNLYLGVSGQTSCGCFGHVRVSPWVTCLIDAGALVALAIWRPSLVAPADSVESPSLFRRGATQTVLLLSAVGGAFFLLSDSPMRTLALLRGEAITVTPAVSDVGEGEVGEVRTFEIQLSNRTSEPIRLVGGTAKCSCLATKDLPLTLHGGETQSVQVIIKFTGSEGRFQHPFVFLADDPRQPTVVARFSGRVANPR